jgi:hypothetical protein
MPEQITYRREDDGRWRWLYINPEAQVELRSSKTYPSASEARHAAADLYPGVPAAAVPDAPPGEDGLAPARLLKQAAVSLVLLAILFRLLKGAGEKQVRSSSPPPPPPGGRRGQHRGVRLTPPGSHRP